MTASALWIAAFRSFAAIGPMTCGGIDTALRIDEEGLGKPGDTPRALHVSADVAHDG